MSRSKAFSLAPDLPVYTNRNRKTSPILHGHDWRFQQRVEPALGSFWVDVTAKLLVDAFFGRNEFVTKQNDYLYWSNNFPDDFDWYEVHEGSQVYRRKDHNGVWALKGDRLEGLDITLSKAPSHTGTRLTLKRDEEYPFAWTVVISDLAGPFTKNVHKEFEKSWGDRRNFQASYGLKATDQEDLEEGAAILDAMYNPFSPFGRLNRRKET